MDHFAKNWSSENLWLTAARVFAGTAFVLAGAGKLPERMQFVDVVISYHVLPYAVAWSYGVALPWLELTIGSLFISGVFVRLAAGISLPLIISFMVANGISLYQGKVVCTSCFGEIIIAVPTPIALAIDLVFLGLMLYILKFKRQKMKEVRTIM